ncbi:MAG: tRNA adenosine(34) deaminase TadA [Nitrospirota bacterium]
MHTVSATIVTTIDRDNDFMRLALEEAGLAFAEGEVPVGAVLVKDDEVIAKAHNSREKSKDPTGHAEILAFKAGTNKISNWRLTNTTLYVTKEPCIMCAGAMINARLSRLVYGCKDLKAGAVDSLYKLLSDRRLNHQVEVVSGVLEEECAEILQRFFKSKR